MAFNAEAVRRRSGFLCLGVEGTAEVFFEVAYDFFFDAAFQQGQKKSQFRLYPDFVFTHCDHAVGENEIWSPPGRWNWTLFRTGIFIVPVANRRFAKGRFN